MSISLQLPGREWPVVQPTLELILFSSDPRQDVAPGIVAFYRACVERYPRRFAFYKTNVMKKSRPLDTSDQLAVMLSDKKALRSPLLGIEQHAGPSAEDFGPPAFEFFSTEDVSEPDDPIRHTFVRLCLPMDEAGRPDDVVAFVSGAVTKVSFDSGYCGYSFLWDTGDSDVERELAKVNPGWLMRHPGLAYGEPLALFEFADRGLLGVSWLTLVGSGLMEKIGGIAAIEAAVGSAVTVMPLGEERAMIRATQAPELGDVNRGLNLQAYRTVGQALAEVSIPDDVVQDMPVAGMSAEQVVAWYSRFFRQD